MVDLDVRDWDKHLPAVQLAVNLRTRYRTQSTPFSLMFARQFNKLHDYNEPDQYKTHPNEMLTVKELQEKAEYMSQVVFPAIKDRAIQLAVERSTRFNKNNMIVNFQVGDWVMVRLPHRESKLDVAFEGPFQIVQKKGSTYVLKDETNELLHRDYVPSELKLVSVDETAIEDQVYEVDEIRDHRGPPMAREYLVKWKGYGEREKTRGKRRSPSIIH